MKALALVLCVVAVSALSPHSSRAKKHHPAPHSHHQALRDLEMVESTKGESVPDLDKMEGQIAAVLSDVSVLKKDLEKVQDLEKSLRDKLADVRTKKDELHVDSEESTATQAETVTASVDESDAPSSASEPTAIAVEAPALEERTEEPKDYSDNLNDALDSTFLELKNIADDMNGGAEDDEGLAPSLVLATSRMKATHPHALVQHGHGVAKYDGEEGVTFGMTGDGTGRQFEIRESGETYMHAPPEVPSDMVKPNDAKYRVDPNDHTLHAVATADVEPSNVPVDSSVPGTFGKGWSLNVGVNSSNPEEDSVCVCKRRGAPRGFDRVRCKRYPSPSPSPSVVVKEEPSIVQCTNGTWPKSDSVDSNTRDIICVYYPARAPVPSPAPSPSPQEPDYPPECYDPRNEFVAPEVERLPFNSMLLEQGYEKCNCAQ